MVPTPEHLTEHLLEVRVFDPVDDGVDSAVTDDEGRTSRELKIVRFHPQMDGNGGETHEEGAQYVEEILGDLHLSFADLPEWLGAAIRRGREILHLDPPPRHLLHVACHVAVNLEVTDEQDDECHGEN